MIIGEKKLKDKMIKVDKEISVIFGDMVIIVKEKVDYLLYFGDSLPYSFELLKYFGDD